MTGTDGCGRLLIKADIVVPVVSGPVPSGGVVCNSKTVEVGPFDILRQKHPEAHLVDLSGCVLLPGLINAHCHLEYSELRGAIPPKERFFEWIAAMVRAKMFMAQSHYLRSLRIGAAEAMSFGTTTVVDVTSSYLTRTIAAETPLRLFIFHEILGLNPFGVGKRMRRLEQALAAEHAPSVLGVGLSPHSIYSMSRRLAKRAGALAAERVLSVAIHIAESADEVRFCRERWRIPSPVRYFDDVGLLGRRTLAVHLNVVTDDDIALCAARGVSVVHCPGSHRYFRHPPFAADRFRDAGVPICLGTDSLASNESLDMFREMRLFAEGHPSFSAREVLEMAMRTPAAFLGLGGRLGCISAGAEADLVGVRVDVNRVEDVFDAVLRHEGPVAFSMIGGRCIIGPREGLVQGA